MTEPTKDEIYEKARNLDIEGRSWQSEFLQLASFVVLATYFIHRGSPQSRESDDQMAADIKAIKNTIGA
jgi:hypothetical protein